MTRDQIPAAVLLAAAFGLIVAGVAMWSVPAALIVAGLLLTLWAALLVVPIGGGSGG